MNFFDKKVIQCNFREGTSECAEGARAYVLDAEFAGDRVRRVQLLARSRSGRWIQKWEAAGRLRDFRFKTIPPEHAVYEKVADTLFAEDAVRRLNDESKNSDLKSAT
jgi:hypothetical protein